MYPPALLALISAAAFISNSYASKVGDSGKLSSLDGGLGGSVTVDSNTILSISNYKLADASAPELYWWGSAGSDLSSGFRISNTHVTQAATSNSLDINLDAGHTAADFNTVGLWCEKFKTNFGQATLSGGSGTSTSNGNSTSTSSGTSATKTGAASVKSAGSLYAVVAGAVVFSMLMV